MYAFFGGLLVVVFLFLFVMYDRTYSFKWWKPVIQGVVGAIATLFFLLMVAANQQGIEVSETFISNQLEIGTSTIYFQDPVEINKTYLEYSIGSTKTPTPEYQIIEIK